jgi:hypothetical protein
MFSLLHPLLLMAVMAPAILLVAPREHSFQRVQLEWAAVLLASLAISTSPASYLFTLLILPVVLIWGSLQQRGKSLLVAILLLLYVAAGSLGGKSSGGDGWDALIEVPRLGALLLLVGLSYLISLRQYPFKQSGRELALWVVALLTFLMFNIATNLHHQQGLYADYKWRIAEPPGILSATQPIIEEDSTLFIGLLNDGYHSAVARGSTVKFSNKADGDHLAITATNREHWIEQAGTDSTVRSTLTGRADIQHAESPVVSFDGHWLAFLKEDHGRAQIWARPLDQGNSSEMSISPPELNVLEMSFLPQGSLIFAADTADHSSLYIADLRGNFKSLYLDDARYPSVSPDGRWLAFSKLQSGNWNLWLRDLSNGQTSRLTHAECNDTEAAWTSDSRTLVYASDCGRGLWLSALCRRRVIP